MQTQTSTLSRRSSRAATTCDERGYHGPFLNRERYDRHPEWRGMGDCLECGLTRDVARNEARRAALTAAR